MQNTLKTNDPGTVGNSEGGETVGKYLVFGYEPVDMGKSKRKMKLRSLILNSLKPAWDKMKFTAFDLSTAPPKLIRRDYALADLRNLGWKLPAMYIDELGNIRGEKDQIIMEGPNGTGNVVWGTEVKSHPWGTISTP